MRQTKLQGFHLAAALWQPSGSMENMLNCRGLNLGSMQAGKGTQAVASTRV